jgi:hypothetical protein
MTTREEADFDRAWAIAGVYYKHRPTAEDSELIAVAHDAVHYLDAVPTDTLMGATKDFACSGNAFNRRLFQGYVLHATPQHKHQPRRRRT